MSADGIRLSRRQGLALHLVAAVLFLSGAAAAACDLLAAAGRESELLVDAKPWVLKVHGAAAMLFLVGLGSLLPTHVVTAWRARRNRVGGAILLGVFVLLGVTGYGLYYAGGEQLRTAVQWTHLIVGLVEPAVLLAHIFSGRLSRPMSGNG